MEMIISALISAASAIIVCIIGNSVRNKKIIEELNKKDILQAYKIELLEKQAEKYALISERVCLLEKDRELTAEKIRAADHRLDSLERGRRK